MVNKSIVFLLALAFLLVACPSGTTPGAPVVSPDTYRFTALNPLTPHSRSLAAEDADWYKDEIFYHVWMSAFADSDSNGEGDIRGIINNLDYLADDLGVTALWLSPFFKSGSGASNRHNYDVTDLYTVNPVYGTNADMYELIEEAHNRGLRLIFDHVPNHVSNDHPWFTQSAASADNPLRSWFNWRSTRPAGWTGWDSYSDFHGPIDGHYYYGVFWDGMPDLNYRTAAVRNAMGNAVIYWLNAGFDGIRVDAVKYLYEDWNTSGSGYADQPETFRHFGRIRADILDAYGRLAGPGGHYHKFMVAENWDYNRTNLLSYMQHDGEQLFNMTLDFPFASAAMSRNYSDLINHWQWAASTVDSSGGWMGSFLNNHDNVFNRPINHLGGDEGLVRLTAALKLTGVGTPFIYYGNETGMPQGAFADDRRHRTPFDWSRVTSQRGQADSLLTWHKALNTLRKDSAALRRGSVSLLRNDASIFAFERAHEGERVVVVANKTSSALGGFTLTVSSAADADTLFGTTGATISGGTLTIPAGLAGYAVRVIRLGTAEDGLTLIQDIGYTAPPPPPFPAEMYLKGSFATWTSIPENLMTRDAGTQLFTKTVNLPAGEATFKFHDNASPSANWYGYAQLGYDASLGPADPAPALSTDVDGNIIFTATGGSYTFRFKYDEMTWSLKKL